jgi:hypothetical protein
LTYFSRLACSVVACTFEYNLIGAVVNEAHRLFGRHYKNIAAHSSRGVAFVRYWRADVFLIWIVLKYTAHSTAAKA